MTLLSSSSPETAAPAAPRPIARPSPAEQRTATGPGAVHALTLLAVFALFALATAGCGATLIPNTDVEDTPENREILAFVEEYRHAVEERDVGRLLRMAHPRYLDRNGTPSGDDDVDYEALRAKLGAWRDGVLDVRYEIRYRRVTQREDRVYVDYTYTASFRTADPSTERGRWSSRLADNRLVLQREGGELKVLSGM
jgi:hypothetical protein